MVVTPAIRDEIHTLAGRGLSHREIARRTGIGRATVRAIIEGVWTPRPETVAPAARRCGACGRRIVTRECQICRVENQVVELRKAAVERLRWRRTVQKVKGL